ncbi:hypothetical protein GCM10009677_07960 [Sphaerisporangium rubeum]
MVEAARRAEERAGDGLYDVYADRLTDFAYSLAQEMDAAADAVHAAIVTAHGRADLLRETSRLRAWLYALTRFHVYERVGRTPAHGFTAGQAHEHDHDVADPELTGVVREALAEMGQREREVLLLAVRHGLTTAEIGVVLGLSSRQAGNRLARAKEQLDVAGAGVILARTGRAHCPDLSALVDSMEGPFPQAVRRRLTRHIAGCEECTEGRGRRVSSERLLDEVPVAFPPLSLRRRVAESCSGVGDDAARAAILGATDRFDKNGFPPVSSDRRMRGDRGGSSRRGRGDRDTAVTVVPGLRDADADTDHVGRQRRGKAGGTPATGMSGLHGGAGTPAHGTRIRRGVDLYVPEGTPAHGVSGRHGGGSEDPSGTPARGMSSRHGVPEGTPAHGVSGRHGVADGTPAAGISGRHGVVDGTPAAGVSGRRGVAAGVDRTGHLYAVGADDFYDPDPGHDEWETEPAGGGHGDEVTAPRGGRRGRRGGDEVGRGDGAGRGGGVSRNGGAGRKKGRRGKSAPVLAAVACVLVATGAMVVAAGQDSATPPTAELRFPSKTPGELRITYPDPTEAVPSASRTAAAERPRATPTPERASAPADSPAARPTVTRSPSRGVPAPAARLVLSCPGVLGENGAGVILISARNAALQWSAAASGGVSVSPGRGVLAVGEKVRLSVVAAEPGKAGAGSVTFSSAAGQAVCPVTWDGQEQPPQSEPPPDPTSPPDPVPSDTPSDDATGAS